MILTNVFRQTHWQDVQFNMFKHFSNSWMCQQDVKFGTLFVTVIESKYRRVFVWTWCTYRDKHINISQQQKGHKRGQFWMYLHVIKVLRVPGILKSTCDTLRINPTQADWLPEHRGGARLHMGGGVKSQKSQWEGLLMMMRSSLLKDGF